MDPADAQGSQLLPLTPDVLTDSWPANNELKIDELTFTIYHTPGHTKGGVCLSCYGLLFSGDTLFAGSCGRTDFPGGSAREMQQSLSLLAELPLPDATKSPARARGLLHTGAGAQHQSLYEWGMVLNADYFTRPGSGL